jgi:endonuclease YncB( thermonuclease family)
LTATLLERGLAQVVAGDFPERAEYLQRECKAREKGHGVWAPGQP